MALEWLLRIVYLLSKGSNKIAEIALACMILLTVSDVVLSGQCDDSGDSRRALAYCPGIRPADC